MTHRSLVRFSSLVIRTFSTWRQSLQIIVRKRLFALRETVGKRVFRGFGFCLIRYSLIGVRAGT